MSEALRPYPHTTDSGIPWAGDIPSHWRTERAKWLFTKMERPVRPEDETVTCFRDGVVMLRKNRRTTGFTESLQEIGYQGIRKGDLVIHAMDAFAGAVGVSDSDGKGTPVYAVCKPNDGVDAQYYARVVREMARSQYIAALAKGIRQRSTDFRYSTFAGEKVPVPPIDEQLTISRFLIATERRVNRLIRTKQRLITLLNEQKQAIIQRAVTRGIDPDVTVRATDNQWFPLVPLKWNIVTLGRVIQRAADGPHHSPNYLETGVPFLSARNVKVDRWSLEDIKFISQDDFREFSRRVVPEKGDVLYTKGGTTGVARVVDLEFDFQVWVHIAVLKLNRNLVAPHYLAMALNSPSCYEQSQLLTRGATNQDLGLSRMKRITLPIPPTVEEQERIVADVNDRLSGLDDAISRAESEINLIREYRTRLIADVVTGKLDVRSVEVPELEDSGPDDYVTEADDELVADEEVLAYADD